MEKLILNEDWFDDMDDQIDDSTFLDGGVEFRWGDTLDEYESPDGTLWVVRAATVTDPFDSGYDKGDVLYFVVDEDADFIDWGPCDTLDEAQEFMLSKEDDYEDEDNDDLDPEEAYAILDQLDLDDDAFEYYHDCLDELTYDDRMAWKYGHGVQSYREVIEMAREASKDKADDYNDTWEDDGDDMWENLSNKKRITLERYIHDTNVDIEVADKPGEIRVNGTHMIDKFFLPYDAIDAILGAPTIERTFDGEDIPKSFVEWHIKFNGHIGTIYDWKNPEPPTENPFARCEWHIGGFDNQNMWSYDLIDFLKGKGNGMFEKVETPITKESAKKAFESGKPIVIEAAGKQKFSISKRQTDYSFDDIVESFSGKEIKFTKYGRKK